MKLKNKEEMLLGTLGASLLRDVLSKGLSSKGVIRAGEGTIRAGKGVIRAGEGTIRAGKGVIRAGEGTIRAGYGSKKPFIKTF